jgi:hypothetical protein
MIAEEGDDIFAGIESICFFVFGLGVHSWQLCLSTDCHSPNLHSALFLASRTHAVSSYLAAQKATTFVFGPSSLSDSQEHEEK